MIFVTARSSRDGRPAGEAVRPAVRWPAMRHLALAVLGTLATAAPAAAHPAPFSYVDIVLGAQAVTVTVVAHVFDVAHDLGLESASVLQGPAGLTARGDAVAALLGGRFEVTADDGRLRCTPSAAPEIVAAQSAVRASFTCATERPPGLVRLRGVLFPYDPVHQTFVNVYESGQLQAQAVLDKDHPVLEHFAGTRQGAWAVAARFLPAGVHHILIGPDHVLFLVGLLLLGGSLRQLALVVTAFTLAHSLTLTLAVLGIVSPPARLVEPAIALSIVYVGADNLLVKSGRDLRPWIALVFGLVHGLGFASVLREMDLPRRALGWSLFSFNLGVEIGQLVVVAVVASALAAVKARSEWARRRLAVIGSAGVVVAGGVWFVQRLFFP
jgi:hydrogenase/urease accessory protein HupE